MAQAKVGDTVRVHYTGRLEDGTTFDSSLNRDPIEFTLGLGQLIPGFEQAIIGMEPGESKTTTIPADQAFGPRREDMMLEIDREHVPPGMDLQVGQQLEISQADGQVLLVTVAEVTESKVTLDANHPLAGQDLTFDIQLLEIL